jgi:hypothetical protein
VVDGGTGHDERGRFTKNNKCAVGNPFAREVTKLRAALVHAITPDKMTRLAERLYAQAMEGNVAAAELLLRYCIGRALPAPDPDDMDADEWRRLRDGPGAGEFCVANIDTIPTAQAVELLRQLRERLPADPGRQVGGAEILAEQAARRRRRK